MRLLSALYLAFLPLSIFAQSDSLGLLTDMDKAPTLENVVVTGTRTARKIQTLPVPIQVISQEALRSTGLTRLNEIIQEQTGLITVPVHSGGEGIQIQGMDAQYVLILIDGRPMVGRSEGTLDLSRITLNNVERIEIVKGASSSLYGSEALGGVVNIITKKIGFDEKLKGDLQYKFASFNTHDATASLRYKKNKIGMEIFGNFFSSKGYSLHPQSPTPTVEPYRNFTIQPKLDIDLSKHLSMSASSRLFYQNQDYRSFANNTLLKGDSKIQEWNHFLLFNHQVAEKIKMVYDLYATNYQANEFLKDKDGVEYNRNFYNQWYFRPELRTHFKLGRHILTTGIGMNYENLYRNLFRRSTHLNSEYAFAQFEWYPFEKWNILAGFRYDHHHQYKSQLSPKLGINFKVSPAFSLKTSFGYGYKAPDLRQLYLDFTNSTIGYTVLGYNIVKKRVADFQRANEILTLNIPPNSFSRSLQPERSINMNIGGYFQKEKVSFNFNFFYNIISNLIETRAIAQKTNGQSIFSYFNINKIFTYGVELNTNYKIGKSMSISAGYQYLIAKAQNVVDDIKKGTVFYRDPVTLESAQILQSDYFGLYNRSKHTANVKINYLVPWVKTKIILRVFYRSKYGLFDSNNNGILDAYDVFVKGYFLVNLTLEKEFKYGIRLQAGTLNLLNYTDKRNISSLPGRQLFARISYSF